MNWTLLIAMGAFVTSVINSILLYSRDQREKEKHLRDKVKEEKKLKIQIGLASAVSDMQYDPENGPYENHYFSVPLIIRNTGENSIFLDQVKFTFLKPLTGERITSFTLNVNDSDNELQIGRKREIRLETSFDTEEKLSRFYKTSIKITVLDVLGQSFHSSLEKLKFGDA